MTALADTSPRTRLRVAADTAPGARVLVAVADLHAVLAVRDETPVDLDGLTGWVPAEPDQPAAARPTSEQAETAADRVVTAIRSRHVVVLPVSCEGARRLAEAAWTTSHLADEFGPWMSPMTAPGCSTVLDAAHRALEWLAAQPGHDERGAGDPR